MLICISNKMSSAYVPTCVGPIALHACGKDLLRKHIRLAHALDVRALQVVQTVSYVYLGYRSTKEEEFPGSWGTVTCTASIPPSTVYGKYADMV
jgi:hypothetical protein